MFFLLPERGGTALIVAVWPALARFATAPLGEQPEEPIFLPCWQLGGGMQREKALVVVESMHQQSFSLLPTLLCF